MPDRLIVLIFKYFCSSIFFSMEYQQHTLNNGIRIVHYFQPGSVAHCGLLINAGSRDEQDHERGLAHFIEHVFFKGTQKRRAYHILGRLDDVGGELNAYTTKEETCIHASVLIGDYQRAVELIHDIVFHSVFPDKELEKEKEVIVDEINSYKDTPSELIFDEFEELLYPNDPMGYNILGTPEHLQTFTRTHAETFIRNNYHTDQMVFCSAGNIPFRKVVSLCEKYFGAEAPSYRTTPRPRVVPYRVERRTDVKDTHQCHVVMGNVAYDNLNPKRLGLHLLNNILGGPGMNSRLNIILRERNGIAYNVESSYTPCFGTGIFTLYFGTDVENLDRSMSLIHKELVGFCQRPLTTIQLHKAVRQLKGQIMIGAENVENQMLSIGKSMLVYNKVDSLSEVCRKIDQISAADLQEIANEIFDPAQLSMLIYK